jgi:hypothetical protein
MKVSLPRSLALKVADYLEHDVVRLESSYWNVREKRVTPKSTRLEVERVKKWIAQIRAAGESEKFHSLSRPNSALRIRKITVKRVPKGAQRLVKVGDVVSSIETLSNESRLVKIRLARTGAEFYWGLEDLNIAMQGA